MQPAALTFDLIGFGERDGGATILRIHLPWTRTIHIDGSCVELFKQWHLANVVPGILFDPAPLQMRSIALLRPNLLLSLGRF
jgi:hypothetical protein